MAEVQWIKFYIDMFDKRKIKKLRRLPAGNEILLIWVMLLAMAGKCNAGGMIYITESVPFTEEDLADELDFEVNTIKLALEAFEKLDMISRSEDGFINVTGWKEYQNVDKLAELRAKDRERKRLKRAEAKALREVSTDVHGMSTEVPSIEEEREEDKEKELEVDVAVATSVNIGNFELQNGTLGRGVVLLTPEQDEALLDKLGFDAYNHYVSKLAAFIIEKDAKVGNHYATILKWAKEDAKV
jgi:predicted phage replisome organizer